MVRKKDPLWEYVEPLDGRFICKFCEKDFAGGVPRIKSHLSRIKGRDIEICTKVPEDVQAKAFLAVGGSRKKARTQEAPTLDEEQINTLTLSKGSKQSTVPGMYKSKDKDAVEKKLAKFFISNNIAFNIVQVSSFKEFLQAAMDYGPSCKISSYSTLRTKLVPNARKDAEEYVAKVKKSWVTSGCTLMPDIWSDAKQRAFINMIAYSPRGAVMVKSFEVSKEKKTAMYLRNILDSVVDEIGPQNIVQFITNNATNFESTGDMLIGKYPHLYKTRCAAHGIQLLLKDIYTEVDWVKKPIDDAKVIAFYMYKHTIILSLMRKHTNDRELKRPCMTRFASNFQMLESILKLENELRTFIASTTWRGLEYSKKPMAQKVTSIIQSSEFWKQGKEVVNALEPLVRVLRLVDGDGSTAGYLYEAMERAKEAIKNNCNNNRSKYMKIWTLFETRRCENIIHPVHCVAALLNPAYMCSENFRETKEMKDGISYLLEHMIVPKERSLFMKEVQLYRLKVSSTFTQAALTMSETSHPRGWWDFCGDSLPTIQKYAIRILSQPCSSSPCERNWSAWEAAQTKKSNRLSPEMLDNLVYVRMNTMMMEKLEELEAKDLQPISLDHLNELPDYVDPPQDDGVSDTDALDLSEDELTWMDEDASPN